MKGRYKPNQAAPSSFESSLSQLPTTRPVAVYYRQSTAAQIGNVSTYIQTIDIPSMLRARGWGQEHIRLIDADQGVSGQTKIDEREGMKQLFSLITAGEIGTVACQDEDRLFRDITQIQVNIFIEACRANQVQVLTPSMTYDFADPRQGTYHARQFRFKSEMAADYITTVIKGKLNMARLRVMHEGKWAGGNVPFGFMVDQRRTISGVPNPNWRKLTEFEPCSRVLNQWFLLFYANNGNMRRTWLQIERQKLYPDLTLPVPQGFYYVKPKQLPLSEIALKYIFSNVAYIGHWVVQGRVVIHNNHPGIVPKPVFMHAYNFLCAHDFDGNENKYYLPFQEHARPSKEEERGVERPLLSGMMFAPFEGDWVTVNTRWAATRNRYIYGLSPYRGVHTYVWSYLITGTGRNYGLAAAGRGDLKMGGVRPSG